MNDFGLTHSQLSFVISSLSDNSRIESAWFFGSRATNSFKDGSDLDIALTGSGLSEKDVSDLKEIFELSTFPYRVDIVIKEKITNEKLLAQIENEGVKVLSN
ncbi:nucleotidyltransferase domain-containing protein [Parashewanella curva]|uniref:Nucleotidyltransferase domain-containing protein n=1 Tax=Parashewanella curva TaxID=2338552 RepID=A0A3L8Q3N9_9GAMM|nr:nucleotidyltransferase domain-containing protein [Parashewanella curva]RLV61402.1 nucleotidyltransferase domain-containing protein [Parashewanella curva]